MANGIPALLSSVANVTNTASLLVADASNILGFFCGPQWGIFNQDGSLAIQPDSMISLDFKREWKLPNYSQEQGSFQNYNKVALPGNTRIRMSKGGNATVRQEFLIQVATAAASLDLYNIVMPEGALIVNVNFLSYSMARTATNGAGMITIDMDLEEIRTTATSTYTNTAAPSGADPANTGAVQAQPATLYGVSAGTYT